MSSMQAPPQSPRRDPRSGLRVVGQSLSYGWRQARRIFHVLVGITFFFFAASGATLSYSEWQAYTREPANGIWRFAMLSSFTVLLLVFGVYSIAKARSVR